MNCDFWCMFMLMMDLFVWFDWLLFWFLCRIWEDCDSFGKSWIRNKHQKIYIVSMMNVVFVMNILWKTVGIYVFWIWIMVNVVDMIRFLCSMIKEFVFSKVDLSFWWLILFFSFLNTFLVMIVLLYGESWCWYDWIAFVVWKLC